MLRVLVIVVVAIAVIALVTRSRGLRRALWTILAIIAVYALLKGAGVIDALAPDRGAVL